MRSTPLLLLATATFAFAAEPAATPKPAPKATPEAKATPAPKPAESKATPAPPKATPAPKPPRKPEDAVTPTVKNPERHEKFLEQVKQGDIDLVFLGDSITDGWPKKGPESWAKFAPYKPLDLGISGDRTEHVLWRITNGELDGINPKGVVIMIGTNNVGHFADEKPEWAAKGVKKILDVVHEKLPKAKVLLLAVFPRGTADSAPRKAVNELNALIAKFADGKAVRFLDIGKVFLDDKGEIPADVMPDKLHPNAHGYDLWYDAIAKPLAEMMADKPAATPKPSTKTKKKKK